MATLPVERRDGTFRVILSQGQAPPIMFEGRPVSAFLPGWEPVVVFAGFAPILLLELRHVDGGQATWFLDAGMNRLGDAVGQLSPEHAAMLRTRAAGVFLSIWRGLVPRVAPALDATSRAFFAINRTVRRQILLLCSPFEEIETTIVDLSSLQQDDPPPTTLTETGNRVALNPDVLGQLIATDSNDTVIAGIQSGAMRWRSPVDGETLPCDTSITTDATSRFAYRVADHRHDLVFYVLALGNHCLTVGIYFPSEHVIYTDSAYKRDFVQSHYPPGHRLGAQFLTALCDHGDIIESYLRAPRRGFSMAVRGQFDTHVGVYIWGVLTGVEKVARLCGEAADFEAIVFTSPNHEEKFGAIDDLFPELRGRVNRRPRDLETLFSYAYADRRCLVQVSDQHVARRIGERIVATNEARADVQSYRRDFEPIRARACPVVLLGLRVENRTLIDLPGFCHRLIAALARYAGEVAVIIDGHNAPRHDASMVYPSDYQEFASRSPVEIEQEIVADLSDRFRGTPVHLVSTIAQPLGASVFWGSRADFMVTPWGAGLAKYRWVCNKPGLVITSRWNLRHRDDLRIYDAPEYFDGGPGMEFLPEQYVEDDPSAPLLFPATNFPRESIWNFTVNEDAVFERVLDLLARYKPRGTTPPG